MLKTHVEWDVPLDQSRLVSLELHDDRGDVREEPTFTFTFCFHQAKDVRRSGQIELENVTTEQLETIGRQMLAMAAIIRLQQA